MLDATVLYCTIGIAIRQQVDGRYASGMKPVQPGNEIEATD
jgi:hypothetical protein